MARKKKEVEHFKTEGNQVLMKEEDITNLTEFEKEKISFFVQTLGYEMVFIEEEPKKNNYFTVDKAEAFLRKNDKEGLEAFRDFKKKADKVTAKYKALVQAEKDGGDGAPDKEEIKEARNAMVTAQRNAFLAQKEWFKETYGIDTYHKVRKEY